MDPPLIGSTVLNPPATPLILASSGTDPCADGVGSCSCCSLPAAAIISSSSSPSLSRFAKGSSPLESSSCDLFSPCSRRSLEVESGLVFAEMRSLSRSSVRALSWCCCWGPEGDRNDDNGFDVAAGLPRRGSGVPEFEGCLEGVLGVTAVLRPLQK